MQNGNREALRFAILRVIAEADDGVFDEDLEMAVSYYVETTQSDIDVEVGDLFVCDMISREDTTTPWRLMKEL
jgi:hypothetical protein